MRLFIHILLLLCLAIQTKGQDLELANEYFTKEEYNKAKVHFELALKKRVPISDVYPKYPKTLVGLGEINEADRFYKKMLKSQPQSGSLKIDYLLFLKDTRSKDYEKQLAKTQKDVIEDNQNFPAVLYYLKSNGQNGIAEKFIVHYRKEKRNPTAFYKEKAEIDKALGNSREMAEELLLGLLHDAEEPENIKNILQNYLSEPEEFDHFKNLLLDESRKDPENVAISELLLWLFIQQRDFDLAAIHARAIDKKQRTQGKKQYEIAELAMENKNFDAAISIYSKLIKDYPNTTAGLFAKGRYISAREQKIKSKYPVDKNELITLIQEYKSLIKESAQNENANSYKYKADMAILYGFYLNQTDSAIYFINSALKESRADKKFQSQARLQLGDLYLIDNQPWESTLLYSQVEALEKDQLPGHEAKLRNAKLHYYSGDFALAQEQMDVLKLATSREISNDAIQLSVLIQDNIIEDTTGQALKRYSGIELLIFRNKWEEAKKELDSLYKDNNSQSLRDDILMLKSKIEIQFGEYPKAIQSLDDLLKNHSEDILADDAAYKIAQLYDYNLKNNEKAMEYYNKVITQFPASIFVVDARKRFRELRGDKVN